MVTGGRREVGGGLAAFLGWGGEKGEGDIFLGPLRPLPQGGQVLSPQVPHHVNHVRVGSARTDQR